MKPAIVDSTQCHLWTDALHARQLAREALNKWDRGTYVRMAVTTVWIALETSCQEALDTIDIGYRFKKNLDRAIKSASLPPIDWSQGSWQKVRALQVLRKAFVHRFLSLQEMFPEAAVAEDAIETVRIAIIDIFTRTGKPVPTWIGLNDSRGWQSRSMFGGATITMGHHGAKMDDPNTVKIYLVIDGEEKLTTVLPSGHDPTESVEHLLTHVNVPISAIRVYDSGQLVKNLIVNMRGNG
jgi:hypothetical protein